MLHAGERPAFLDKACSEKASSFNSLKEINLDSDRNKIMREKGTVVLRMRRQLFQKLKNLAKKKKRCWNIMLVTRKLKTLFSLLSYIVYNMTACSNSKKTFNTNHVKLEHKSTAHDESVQFLSRQYHYQPFLKYSAGNEGKLCSISQHFTHSWMATFIYYVIYNQSSFMNFAKIHLQKGRSHLNHSWLLVLI